MSVKLTQRQIKQENERRKALRAFLDASEGEPDATSLARSYGLSEPIVQQVIRQSKGA